VLVDPEVLFRRYVYTPGASATWRAHCDELSQWLRAAVPVEDAFVVEPASNDGTLLREIDRWAGRVLGIDPAENIAQAATAAGIETIPRFFGAAVGADVAAEFGHADLIVGTNVLAHVPDIVDFIRGASRLLTDHGLFVIEAPYLVDLVAGTAYDSIYHEHVSYLSVSALANVLPMGGLTLTHVERTSVHGGSIRFVGRQQGHHADASVDEFLAEESRLGYGDGSALHQFSGAVDRVRAELVRCVGDLRRGGNRLAAYGATAKGTVLLNTAGLGRDDIEYIVDKSVLKQGLLAPGTGIPVVSPAAIHDDPVDVLAILAWNIKDEIIAQETAFSARGGKFLIPIPFPNLV
jgi:novobiocin biosynthesis protein NovU/D-mycarose 3-C-methyltransferase